MPKITFALLPVFLIAWMVFADEVGLDYDQGMPGLKPSITEISSMGTSRAAHTATRLESGRVLLVGGMTKSESDMAETELFDPSTVRFRRISGPETLRHSHTATLLGNGDVLITGGYDSRGEYLRSAEIFRTRTRTFETIAPMQVARSGHQAVMLDDGRVLLIGGVGTGWSFLSSAEIYDPATGTFTPTGSMSLTRESHVAVKLNDGRVLVVGGHSGRRAAMRIYAETEIYDPQTGQFTPGGNMLVPRHKHDALLLKDGRVLVTAGADERDERGQFNSAEIYDPQTGLFTKAPDIKLRRYKHRGTSTLLPDGTVLLAGGASRAEQYNPKSGYSRIVPGADDLAGQFSSTTPLGDGRVLITGGYGGSKTGPIAKAWIYNP